MLRGLDNKKARIIMLSYDPSLVMSGDTNVFVSWRVMILVNASHTLADCEGCGMIHHIREHCRILSRHELSTLSLSIVGPTLGMHHARSEIRYLVDSHLI
jgi:hypothetical protein